MTEEDLAAAFEQYRAGLEAEIALLRQLQAVAARQRQGTASRDFEQLALDSDTRERLMATLVAIEEGLRPIRDLLSRGWMDLVDRPDYRDIMHLRNTAAELVAAILATDRDSMQALADAELARRAAVASLERGETTLAAYRKIIAPPVSSAALVDRRG